VEGIGHERAIVQRQGRAKLTADLSDYYRLRRRLGAIERREVGEPHVILG
jgi:hypothetical protein